MVVAEEEVDKRRDILMSNELSLVQSMKDIRKIWEM